MSFNENTRVKIPAILHLCRLGYEYLSLSKDKPDGETNIFMDIFNESILRINPDMDKGDVKRFYEDVSLALGNEDLGRAFYAMLTATSGKRLIDFTNFDNNSFHVVTELPCKNGDDEFRPDITLLINGMPLAFIEVKKPNNRDGILAERTRINDRFQNKKFRKFINISQILVFSNNMEYEKDAIEPLQGAFYATSSYKEAKFNYFREEEIFDLNALLKPENEDLENFVLKDNNLLVIKSSPEFLTNKNPDGYTNRILTSLFQKERFAMFLRYGFAYIKDNNKTEKHIMRYPQFFATKAIEETINKGISKGIIWHTQGSGKTALAFYNVQYLTDLFQRKGVVSKFYFIVDRLDLLIQAQKEFSSRGLTVHTVDSKEELIRDFSSAQATHNLSGKAEITVVNIQKFKEESNVLKTNDYKVKIQRVYFVDEAHRGYDLEGSFLANLASSDRNAIMIGLTGTPLIGNRKTKDIFGEYIHKYYYNSSIADGYTLRLLREDIETRYKISLAQALKEIEVLKGDVNKSTLFSHERFAEPMLDYIVEDFINSRIQHNDHSIGGMVVCESSEQAEKLFEIFVNKYHPEQNVLKEVPAYHAIKEAAPLYGEYAQRHKKKLIASIILHDVGTKQEREKEIDKFKAGEIDLLFVYQMLLTGFDSPRLKKLYLGRQVRDHNLLQTLTRVNRPYKEFKHGYVVDFADIREQFDKTNKAYFKELQTELGDEIKNYSNLFKTKEEIENDILDIKEKLFRYDLQNAEIFSQQISQIEDRKTVLDIKKALENAKNLYNLIRLYGHEDLIEKLDFKKLAALFIETDNHLHLLNQREALKNNLDTTNLLNVALENVTFMFRKVAEEELVIAGELQEMLRRTREALNANFDQTDPEFVSLYDELKRMFEKKNLDEVSQEEMKRNIGALKRIYDKVTELNRNNNLLKAKYEQDAKYARLHKRLLEKRNVTKRETELFEMLQGVKREADESVLLNTSMLSNEEFFSGMLLPIVYNGFETIKVKLNSEAAAFINKLLVQEYINEFQGR